MYWGICRGYICQGLVELCMCMWRWGMCIVVSIPEFLCLGAWDLRFLRLQVCSIFCVFFGLKCMVYLM